MRLSHYLLSPPALNRAPLASFKFLKVATPKAIYQMQPVTLRRAMLKAARRRVRLSDLWDAFLYRASVLRPRLSSTDLSLVLESLALVKRRAMPFVSSLLLESKAKAQSFSVRDATLLLNACAKLRLPADDVKDVMKALLPALLNRLNSTVGDRELALLTYSLSRIQLDLSLTLPVKDKIVLLLCPNLSPPKEEGEEGKLETSKQKRKMIRNGHTLSLLLAGFAPGRGLHRDRGEVEEDSDLEEPFEDSAEEEEDFEGGGGAEELSHPRFIAELVSHSARELRHGSNSFKAIDLVFLIEAFSKIREAKGGEEICNQSFLSCISRRLRDVSFDFQPQEMVRVFRVAVGLPGLDVRPLLAEMEYRIRDFSPRDCLVALEYLNAHSDPSGREICTSSLEKAVFFRLMRHDAPSVLSVEEVSKAASLMEALYSKKGEASSLPVELPWEAREALLFLSRKFKSRPWPPVEVVVHVLAIYSRLKIRDTHWLHICEKIKGEVQLLPPGMLGMLAVSLAKLSLPAAAEHLKLFTTSRIDLLTRSPFPSSKSPSPPDLLQGASSLLYAVALFDLTNRLPPSTELEAVGSLVSIAEKLLGEKREAGEEEDLAVLGNLSFFKKCSLSAEHFQGRLLLLEASSFATEPVRSGFELDLRAFCRNLEGVKPAFEVKVPPLSSLVGLELKSVAEHLACFPLHSEEEGKEEEGGPLEEEGEAEDPEGEEKSPPWLRRKQPLLETLEAHKSEYVLVEGLKMEELYHRSDCLLSEQMRRRGIIVSASRFAELRLLQREGWKVACIPEWEWGKADSDEKRRKMLMKAIARVG